MQVALKNQGMVRLKKKRFWETMLRSFQNLGGHHKKRDKTCFIGFKEYNWNQGAEATLGEILGHRIRENFYQSFQYKKWADFEVVRSY